MDSGLTYAKAQNLRPGIALSAQQIALLTTDIAWLQQESVTLADGTVTQALVPHLYATIRAGDLSPTGGLLSGESVNLEATGEVRNGGTILGRKVVQITANTINNINGQIDARDIALHATQDINNVGGTITAQNSLTAIAGRDLNVVSTTQSSAGSTGNYSFAQSGVDRLAGLYVKGPGVLLASAGNNVNLSAAQLVGAGNVTVTAGNSINLQTVQNSQSNNFGAGDANNHLLSGQTRDVGTQVSAGNNLTLSAGQNINAKAADLRAKGALNFAAKGNIVLDAGQTQSTLDSARTSNSSGFLSSTTTSTQTQASASTAKATTLNAQSINVQAGNNLLSVGTDFKAKDSIDVGEANSTLLYATQNVNQSTTTNQSSSSLLGINLSKSEVTDSKAQSLAVATSLISDKKIQIGVGNTTELQGTTVQAPQIAFVQTDPTKAGNLVLSGSTDATQTSHTEKNETLGVYQSAADNGQTTQTLNQTTLKGNVTFDAGLKITAQVPKDVQATSSGQALAKQVQTLQGTLGSSSSGLEYLNQLAANPNVQWDKVALANDKWSYEQAGLTPAGAALLSIAVAAYTGGMGVGALGGTGSTLGGAALTTTVAGAVTTTALGAAVNAGFASLASQAAVAMVNNGGDIGKTLAQLGSEQSIKGLLTTMATAGALQQLGSNPMFTGQSGTAAAGTNGFSATQTAATFSDQLLKNVTNNVAGSAIDSAINGRAFDEKALGNALTNALITSGLAQGANAIGNARVDGNAAAGTANSLNDFTNKIAHAVLGCAGGAATGGGCEAGAVGAVIGEMTAEYAKDAKLSDSQALALAKTLSAASGVLVGGGGDNVAAVNIAATAGVNAAENNYLKHAERLALNNAQKACFANASSPACGTVTALKLKDRLSDKLLSNATASCEGSDCNDVTNFIQAQMSSLGCTGPNTCPDYNTLSSYLRVAQEKAQGLEPVYPEGWILDAKAALDLGKFGVKVLSGVGAGTRGSLDALGQLVKTDANSLSKLTNTSSTELPNVFANQVGGKPIGTPAGTFDMVTNPGPLAGIPGNPASNFSGGKYTAIVTNEDVILYRGGSSTGSPLGQWYTSNPPTSVIQVRIDTAVKPQWINAESGSLTGTSPIDTVYSIKIPAGTTVYHGPVGSQSGVYVGGDGLNQTQIFVPKTTPGVTPVGKKPLP